MPDGDTAGDSKKVNRSTVLLIWQREFAEVTVTNEQTGETTSGASRVAKNNYFMYLTDAFVTYFDVPKFTGIIPDTMAIKAVTVRQHARKRFKGLDELTEVTSDVNEHTRMVTYQGTRYKTHAFKIPTGKITSNGTIATVAIGFPSFFTMPMIAQALGTMTANAVADRKPSFMITPSGRKAPLIRDPASGIIPDFKSGAWVATTALAETATQSVEGTSQPKRGSKQKGGDSNAADNQV
ncbi:MAG TPA: hypothetical protein VLS94_06515 [Fusibacter sp.]|nr:hypothetical protein [Fusibacter sp.]